MRRTIYLLLTLTLSVSSVFADKLDPIGSVIIANKKVEANRDQQQIKLKRKSLS